jgi:hypothetical protein
MKKLTLLFVLQLCLFACAQKKGGGNTVGDNNNPEVFNSKYVRLIEDTIKMMLIENVVIQYGDLYAEADSALLEKQSQLVTAFGVRKATFKDKPVNPAEFNGIIRYKKGEAKLSVN